MKKDQYNKMLWELNRLSAKYRVGKKLKLVWNPEMDQEAWKMIREQLGMQEDDKMSGRVVGDSLIIYEQNFDKAMHIMRHEFFEWFVHNRFVRGYDLMLKLMKNGITRLVYDDKEEALERMAEMEGIEYGRIHGKIRKQSKSKN